VRRAALFLLGPLLGGCSLGQGDGAVKSDALFAHDCWGRQVDATHAKGAGYDMQPNFFAAVPYRETLQIRVQRGTDITEVSDGLSVLIDDVCVVRKALGQACELGSWYDGPPTPTDDFADAGTSTGGGDAGAGATFKVAVPAGVHPPGSPSTPPPDQLADPPLVHMALYLERSCHNQNIVLYGISGTITFTSLFDGVPNETSAAKKLTDVSQFDVDFADLRDVPLGEYVTDVPPDLRSRVTGSFRFYFERGQPGQAFP
jgi:hypothetical protein